jgi:hypothetical protein
MHPSPVSSIPENMQIEPLRDAFSIETSRKVQHSSSQITRHPPFTSKHYSLAMAPYDYNYGVLPEGLFDFPAVTTR